MVGGLVEYLAERMDDERAALSVVDQVECWVVKTVAWLVSR